MFCTKCGKEIQDEAVMCPHCGVPTDNFKKETKNAKTKSGMQTAIKILLYIACGLSISYLFIPLAWCLPMTIYYLKAQERGEKVSTAFKICTLLFVSVVAGVLMLCDDENN